MKDEDEAHPVATAWRAVFRQVVRGLVEDDIKLVSAIPGVDRPTSDFMEQVKSYVAEYGATLTDLADGAWKTSCAQWMGDYWEVLVDLWTEEEGASDLVLHVYVRESDAGYRFSLYMVYVP